MNELAGIRVAVTRPADQAPDLAYPLQQAGAEVLIAPLIRIAQPLDSAPLHNALRKIETFDWLLFSSVNGVQRFVGEMVEAGRNLDTLRSLRIACVGPATAAAAREHGLVVEVVPEQFTGDAIAPAIAAQGELKGRKVLIARARGARMVLPEMLRALGADVVDVETYRSVADQAGAKILGEAIAESRVDVVTLTSGSAARCFATAVESKDKIVIAVIGPVTASDATKLGLPVAIIADPHTTQGLVAAIVNYYAKGS
jgi:uroporphyrinogen III methyltransferase/synthase